MLMIAKTKCPSLFFTCLNSFSMADMTMSPLQTMGAASSTKKPIDILEKKNNGPAFQDDTRSKFNTVNM